MASLSRVIPNLSSECPPGFPLSGGVRAILLGLAGLAGCIAAAERTPPREATEIVLSQKARIPIPDSLQFTGIAVDSLARVITAWGPDYLGYWNWEPALPDQGWRYREPDGWAGTVGAFADVASGEFVAVDSLGSTVVIPTGVVTRATAFRRLSLLSSPNALSGGRVIAALGGTDGPIMLIQADVELQIRGPQSSFAWPRPDGTAELFPLLVVREGRADPLLVPRSVRDPVLAIEGSHVTEVGTVGLAGPMTDLVEDTARQWNISGAVDLNGGVLLTLADLKSDKRVLARYSDDWKLLACRVVSAPYAVVARSPGGRFALAGLWDRGGHVILYEVGAGKAYKTEATTCQV